MPHAETTTTTMTTPMVNGEKPSSKTISHITSYPVVSDSISYYKSNAYGQRSISLANSAYDRFGKPFQPYIERSYSIVAPYVAKADTIGDDGLNHLDTHFPIVKEDTNKIKDNVLSLAWLPFRIADQGKEYVFGTFNDEYSKTQGDGVFKLAKATISTELKIALDGYHYILSFLTKSKEETKHKLNEKLN